MLQHKGVFFSLAQIKLTVLVLKIKKITVGVMAIRTRSEKQFPKIFFQLFCYPSFPLKLQHVEHHQNPASMANALIKHKDWGK